MNGRLIAICGFEGSGKDTVATLLSHHGFVAVAFADTLKQAVASIFGWDYELLKGCSVESRQWREKVDPYWENELGIKGLTPRKVLQYIGTDVMRQHFHKDIWLLSLKKKMIQLLINHHVVVTDCRFPNEVDLIKELGGRVILINRPLTTPAWLNLYDDIKATYIHSGIENEDLTLLADLMYERYQIHPAETSLINYSGFDYTINNDGTLQDLYDKIVQVLNL